MESSKALQEQIDALAIEAKALVAVAKKESRELDADEASRFDAITDKNAGEIATLKTRLKTALNTEQTILDLSNESRRQNSVQELDEILNGTPSEPRLTLPVNGKLPNSNTPADADRVYVKQARLKAFKTERDAYNAGMWYRAIVSRLYSNRGEDVKALQHCHRVGYDVSNAAYEGSGTTGGYLVPPQISSTIIEVRENVGIARRVCSIQPMTSDTATIPKRSGGLTVYYPAELGTITDSDKSWQQIALVAQKRAVASKISQELVDDALISIVDNVVTEQAYALALQEDNELINGTGASSYGGVQGLLSAIGSSGVYTCPTNMDTWPEVALTDVFGTMSKLPDRFNRSPVWICSHNFYWAVFARLLGAAGGASLAEVQSGVGGVRSFFGIPVYTTSQMPVATAAATVSALFGQFDMAVVLGDRTGIRVGRDDSLGFLSDYTTLKATARYDMKVHEPGDSSNPGAYVALKTAS